MTRLLRLLPFGVVGLGGFGLNHYGGVAVLVELRLVSDGSHHIAGGQSQSRCQRRQCGNECHDNGFNNLFLVHNSYQLSVVSDLYSLLFTHYSLLITQLLIGGFDILLLHCKSEETSNLALLGKSLFQFCSLRRVG